jgi:hypothetical protein
LGEGEGGFGIGVSECDNFGVVFPPDGRLPHLFPKNYQNIALQ